MDYAGNSEHYASYIHFRWHSGERQQLYPVVHGDGAVMRRTLSLLSLAIAVVAMSACGSVAAPAHAQTNGGSFWTNGSGASIKGTFTTISAEANLDAGNGLASLDLPFQITPSVTISRLQGTISYRSMSAGCTPQALMSIQVDGVDSYRVIVKTTVQTSAVNLFINYSYTVPVSAGQANLHV